MDRKRRLRPRSRRSTTTTPTTPTTTPTTTLGSLPGELLELITRALVSIDGARDAHAVHYHGGGGAPTTAFVRRMRASVRAWALSHRAARRACVQADVWKVAFGTVFGKVTRNPPTGFFPSWRHFFESACADWERMAKDGQGEPERHEDPLHGHVQDGTMRVLYNDGLTWRRRATTAVMLDGGYPICADLSRMQRRDLLLEPLPSPFRDPGGIAMAELNVRFISNNLTKLFPWGAYYGFGPYASLLHALLCTCDGTPNLDLTLPRPPYTGAFAGAPRHPGNLTPLANALWRNLADEVHVLLSYGASTDFLLYDPWMSSRLFPSAPPSPPTGEPPVFFAARSLLLDTTPWRAGISTEAYFNYFRRATNWIAILRHLVDVGHVDVNEGARYTRRTDGTAVHRHPYSQLVLAMLAQTYGRRVRLTPNLALWPCNDPVLAAQPAANARAARIAPLVLEWLPRIDEKGVDEALRSATFFNTRIRTLGQNLPAAMRRQLITWADPPPADLPEEVYGQIALGELRPHRQNFDEMIATCDVNARRDMLRRLVHTVLNDLARFDARERSADHEQSL